ncbi:hypothetical protein CpPA04_0674 [Corynebacterium pseudotuberculosis]|nr:hypothetical protein CpPA04_0674 [Corynebacterium pseudotuberculosis]ATQ64998.1 Hypothetical protein CpPA07_0685 [Corynebacterium pseudotuberculosis]
MEPRGRAEMAILRVVLSVPRGKIFCDGLGAAWGWALSR